MANAARPRTSQQEKSGASRRLTAQGAEQVAGYKMASHLGFDQAGRRCPDLTGQLVERSR